MPSSPGPSEQAAINNLGWRASPTARGMGIWTVLAQACAARPPWEPLSQATEDGQQSQG